jgi:hypothetical protein
LRSVKRTHNALLGEVALSILDGWSATRKLATSDHFPKTEVPAGCLDGSPLAYVNFPFLRCPHKARSCYSTRQPFLFGCKSIVKRHLEVDLAASARARKMSCGSSRMVVVGVLPVACWRASLAAMPVRSSPRAAASSKALATSSRWSYHHCASSASLETVLSCPLPARLGRHAVVLFHTRAQTARGRQTSHTHHAAQTFQRCTFYDLQRLTCQFRLAVC